MNIKRPPNFHEHARMLMKEQNEALPNYLPVDYRGQADQLPSLIMAPSELRGDALAWTNRLQPTDTVYISLNKLGMPSYVVGENADAQLTYPRTTIPWWVVPYNVQALREAARDRLPVRLVTAPSLVLACQDHPQHHMATVAMLEPLSLKVNFDDVRPPTLEQNLIFLTSEMRRCQKVVLSPDGTAPIAETERLAVWMRACGVRVEIVPLHKLGISAHGPSLEIVKPVGNTHEQHNERNVTAAISGNNKPSGERDINRGADQPEQATSASELSTRTLPEPLCDAATGRSVVGGVSGGSGGIRNGATGILVAGNDVERSSGNSLEPIHISSERGESANERPDDSRSGRAVSGQGSNNGIKSSARSALIDARMTDDMAVIRGAKTRYKANIKAIQLLRDVEAEMRPATQAEQNILMGYSGWGAMPQVLSWSRDRDDKWVKEREELERILTPEEHSEALESTPFAHFTDPAVIRGLWSIAARMGFSGGRVLETSAGNGRMFGFMPQEIADSSLLVGVEKDQITGKILRLLFPSGDMHVKSIQDFYYPENYFDVAISNVPFADVSITSDERYRHIKPQLHDYCILRGMDMVRPGGIGMWLTSTGTLDKSDDRVRRQLFKTCDLIAAFRMPEGNQESAGTAVVCDVLILRKRFATEQRGQDSWLKIDDMIGIDGTAHRVNKWFIEHHDAILGELDGNSRMYRAGNMHVTMTDDYEQRWMTAIQSVPAGIYTQETEVGNKRELREEWLLSGSGSRPGTLYIHEGKICRAGTTRNAATVILPEPTDNNELAAKRAAAYEKRVSRVADYIALRDALNVVLKTQSTEGEQEKRDEARRVLNKSYDYFVQRHGALHKRPNVSSFEDCADANMVLAVERWDGVTHVKADIFNKDTIRTKIQAEPGAVTNFADAVAMSLNAHGKLKIEYLAEMTGQSSDHVINKLSSQRLAYHNPVGGWETADEYLTGNVVEKLKQARSASAVEERYQANVAALEQVIPQRITPDDIIVNLGAPWIPASDIVSFSSELLGKNVNAFDIRYEPTLGQWTVDWSASGRYLAHSQEARLLWGTKNAHYINILESLILRRPIAIYAKDESGNDYTDESGYRRIDRDATEAVASKGAEIEEKFRDWLWSDESRAVRLANTYNDTYNSVVPRVYDGSHLTFPGMSKPCIFDNGVEFNGLRDHQRNAVWQAICRGNALLGHEVGTGKTMTQVAIAMELRRLGMSRKPCLLCLKSNIHQITNEAQQLYPGARILPAFKEFDANTREEMIARIATGDWDLVILTHDQFGRIPISAFFVKQYMEDKLQHLSDLIKSAGGDADADDEYLLKKSRSREVKNLAKARLRLRERVNDAISSERDSTATFEQTGIDYLIVDEAHRFKSLPIHTAMNSVKGIPTSDSSRAVNMDMIVNYLHDSNNNRGIIMATGTPVVNSLCEVYVMQRYVQPHELKKRGIHHFDAWAANFGTISSRMEFTHTGDYKSVERFTKFVNLPELQTIAFQDFSMVRADAVNEISRPKRVDVPVSITPSPLHLEGMRWLQDRARALEEDDIDPRLDNHLSIATDGRLLASDLRLVMKNVDGEFTDQSKVSNVVSNVALVHSQHPGMAQLIFTETNQSSRTGFSLLDEITSQLEANGISRDKIEVFSGMTDIQRMNAASRLNEGKSLVGIGNTQTLGTGINCQRHLMAVHHLDCPWTPAAMEQRNGRVWRQGNHNKSIVIYSYVIEKTLDSWMYQTIARKEKFIRSFMDAKRMEREITDEDEESISYDKIMAIASGNPLLYERINVVNDIETLERADARHQISQSVTKKTIHNNEISMQELTSSHDRMLGDVEEWHKYRGSEFLFMTPDGALFDSAKSAGKYLAEQLLASPKFGDVPLGKYRGFNLLSRSKIVRYAFDEERALSIILRRSEDAFEWEVRPPNKMVDEPESLFSSINANLSGIEHKMRQVLFQIDNTKKATDKLKAEIGTSFRGAADLSRKRMLLQKIDEALSRGDSSIDATVSAVA